MWNKMNLEQAKEVRSSLLWRQIQEELDYRIQNQVNKLRICQAVDLPMIQQKIQMLEEFKSLPDDVVSREEE